MPKWTAARSLERSEGRAARILAIYILQMAGEWPDAPNVQIAEALGISRWTLDRDLASVEELNAKVEEIRELLAQLAKKSE